MTGASSGGQNNNFIQQHLLTGPLDGINGPGTYDVRPGLKGYVLINKLFREGGDDHDQRMARVWDGNRNQGKLGTVQVPRQ